MVKVVSSVVLLIGIECPIVLKEILAAVVDNVGGVVLFVLYFPQPNTGLAAVRAIRARRDILSTERGY